MHYHVSIQGGWIVLPNSVYPAKYHVMITIRLAWHAYCILPSSSLIKLGPNIRMQRKQCNMWIGIIFSELKVPPLIPWHNSNYILSLRWKCETPIHISSKSSLFFKWHQYGTNNQYVAEVQCTRWYTKTLKEHIKRNNNLLMWKKAAEDFIQLAWFRLFYQSAILCITCLFHHFILTSYMAKIISFLACLHYFLK